MSPDKKVNISVPDLGEVDGILCGDPSEHLLVFGHGAGADMNHRHMTTFCEKLADVGVGTLRYQFLYTQNQKKRPDHWKKLLPVCAAAIDWAAREIKPGKLFAGGKSMGGRMTSRGIAEDVISRRDVSGLVFFGFPLHPPKKEGVERADHLFEIESPMLFLQGTRDPLANLGLLNPVVKKLQKKNSATSMHVVDTGDHSLQVLKRSEKTQDEVDREIADVVLNFMSGVVG